jgi:hypothetical protein
MPEFTDMDQAAQALAAANRGESDGTTFGTAENQPPATDPGTQEPPAQTAPDTPEPTTPDSFTDVRYDDLPDELQTILKEREAQMQGDYTRKTQEIASQRAEAEQAMEFIQNLQTDPDFALQVRDEISQALQAAGLSPAEANAEANRQVDDAQTPQPEAFADPDDAIRQELNELKQWREQQELFQEQQRYENELDRMDARIRQENPNYSEGDMKHIYAISYATGGNLLEAEKFYKDDQKRIIQAYIDSKDSAPAPEPGSTGPAQTPPQEFDGLLDPRLMAAAQRRLAESLGE